MTSLRKAVVILSFFTSSSVSTRQPWTLLE